MQLLDLLDQYPGRDALITWIRENGSEKWGEYLDSIAASQDTPDQATGGDEEQGPADPA